MNRWKNWYEQGKRDFHKAVSDCEHGYYEWACFTAQQSAEKVLKALALNRGINVWGHSLTEILHVLSSGLEIPSDTGDKAKVLDMFYIPTRYPNGFPSGKPSDYFTEKQSEEAINAARDIIGFCESVLPGQGSRGQEA